VTHENDIAEHASRQVRFLDGKIVEDTRNKKEKVSA
jgi:putative ABC transport system ATP-binding protein